MSLKSLSKTRWKVEPERVTIYPYGLSYILAAVLAAIFIGIFFVYNNSTQSSLSDSGPLILVLLIIVLLFVGFAGTSIEFNNLNGVMRKKLMGFIPLSSIPYSQIHGISPVSNMAGSYTYRLFKKDQRYGKGVLVSSSYTKNEDPNAIAFIEEVVNTIHHQLKAHDSPGDFKPLQIESYKYFDVQGSGYTQKKNRAGSIILGVLLLGVGIHELTPDAWLGHELNIGRICFLLFMFVGGAALILGGFTKVVFDKYTREIIRKNPIGLGNKTYSFDEFTGLQTVRRSTNFIYSGTDVQMYFLKAGKTREEVLVLQSFFRTGKIERFIAEVNSIIV